MVIMGSSEFNYGKRLIYHPRNIFRKQNMSLMTIGNVYNQSLSHAISLGAITPKLKKNKRIGVKLKKKADKKRKLKHKKVKHKSIGLDENN